MTLSNKSLSHHFFPAWKCVQPCVACKHVGTTCNYEEVMPSILNLELNLAFKLTIYCKKACHSNPRKLKTQVKLQIKTYSLNPCYLVTSHTPLSEHAGLDPAVMFTKTNKTCTTENLNESFDIQVVTR